MRVKSEKNRSIEWSGGRLKDSVMAAARAAEMAEGDVEKLAEKVVKKMEKWVERRGKVTAEDVRTAAGDLLESYNKDAAYVYKNWKKVI